MRDVAAIAGVSVSTVSRVINGAAIDPVLQARVRDAIAVLGYQPHAAAGDLRRGTPKNKTVGLIVADVGNPFFSLVQRGVEDVLGRRGIFIFASSTDEDPERQRQLVDALTERAVSGLLIVPTHGDVHYLERLRARGIPTVFVDRPSPLMDADVVTSDNRAGARRACEHLIAQGHRRIAMLGNCLGIDGSLGVHTTVERLHGYQDALEANGLSPGLELVRHSLSSGEDVDAALSELLSGPIPPTALFTDHNLVTSHTVRSLRRLRASHSIALVGFDDVDMAECSDPPLTVVAQDPRRIGQHAAELLLSRLDGDREPARHVVVPTRLIPRGSGEIRSHRSRRR